MNCMRIALLPTLAVLIVNGASSAQTPSVRISMSPDPPIQGREFNGQIQSRHTGTDLAGVAGAPVAAAAHGVIALVDTFFLAGNVIYIDHGAGLVSAYFHLSAQDVMAGDTVEAGQTIGWVGATGRVTGPHLHWVVRYGAISVDPMSLLDFAKATRPPTRPDDS
jgi:murein DD-endopeptidase MepM/ murein hydrolase activator NlpD